MPAGTTVKTTFADPGEPQLAGTQTVSNNGLVLFAGHQATEVEIDGAIGGAIGGAVLDIKVYGSFDASTGEQVVVTLHDGTTKTVLKSETQ